MSENQHQPDDVSQAAMALNSLPIPEGPSQETMARTLAALRAAAERPTAAPLWRRWNSAGWGVKAVSALAIAAAVLVMCLVLSSGGSVAFAQVAAKLRAAFSFSFDTLLTQAGQQEPRLKYHTSYMESGKIRMDMGDTIMIMDHVSGAGLTLNTKLKTAYLQPMKLADNSPAAELPNQIELLRSMVGKSSHSLGEKEIDGQKVKGFACDVKSDLQYMIWVNARTGDPVRVEFPLTVGPIQGTAALTNFKLDEHFDPALFSVDVPAGFKTIELPQLDNKVLHFTPAENVVEILRAYAQKSDSEFPNTLDDWGDFSKKLTQGVDPSKTDELKPVLEVMQRVGTLSGGYLFSHKKGTDYDYLPGGKLGEKDRIVFWYKDDKTGDYRAVYGDLRIEKINQQQLPPGLNPPPADGKPETRKMHDQIKSTKSSSDNSGK
ncbi:MAG TPA: hypothetical protein VFE46_08030 [Pirellulales bacterium]|jgi:outer membrane lipoprotein-sorting protein|nr:hypothetical protein [Pirellulales bacterium]